MNNKKIVIKEYHVYLWNILSRLVFREEYEYRLAEGEMTNTSGLLLEWYSTCPSDSASRQGRD